MKLAQGEYVALERVESLHSACPIVAQLYVHGDSLQSYLIGIVFPDPIQLAALASRVWGTNVSPQDQVALDKAVLDPKVKDEILQMLNKQARAAGLNGCVCAISGDTRSQRLTVILLTPQIRDHEAHTCVERSVHCRQQLPDADLEDEEVRTDKIPRGAGN